MSDKFTIYGEQTSFLIKNNLVIKYLNTGIIGLDNDFLNWEEIENCIKVYKYVGFIGYLMEQAIYAMYLSNKEIIRLDEKEYTIIPEKAEVKNPKATMHHYPTENRQWYFRYGWKNSIGKY